MKISSFILGGLAALAIMIAVPVQAEMASVSDTDLDGISGKGNTSITYGGLLWDDLHTADTSNHKGGLYNSAVAVTGITGINTANVWGTYAGAESFGSDTGAGSTTSTATSNAGFGGF